MYLKELFEIIKKEGQKAGLDDENINAMCVSASCKLPGNVPRELWEKQVSEWIAVRAQKKANDQSIDMDR